MVSETRGYSEESEVALCGSAQAVSAMQERQASGRGRAGGGGRWRCWRRCCCQGAPARW
ncbi:hypothetical protein CNECB9_1240006 [Cupriavidus necator]|uniref:Uncharacterized protein n=1 Tax=Cupriavidus necator TaxID=106590 RepID=A0A1K0I8P0_CUPNE|nr:hypothetical protein CNECB9_1240006 [Cupriavidus necator]